MGLDREIPKQQTIHREKNKRNYMNLPSRYYKDGYYLYRSYRDFWSPYCPLFWDCYVQLSSHHRDNWYPCVEGALPYPIQMAYENGGNYLFLCNNSHNTGDMAIFLLKKSVEELNTLKAIEILS